VQGVWYSSRLRDDFSFKQIPPEELRDNVFTLVGKNFFLITAGKENHYNSMVGSGGGFGVLFRKPTSWCLLQTTRYTLELMEKVGTYTLSYFPNEYKEQMLFQLTGIQTPSSDMSFKEAGLIFECRLTQLTTPAPDDFCTVEAKEYIREAYKDVNEYRKYAFGEITRVWVKK